MKTDKHNFRDILGKKAIKFLFENEISLSMLLAFGCNTLGFTLVLLYATDYIFNN